MIQAIAVIEFTNKSHEKTKLFLASGGNHYISKGKYSGRNVPSAAEEYFEERIRKVCENVTDECIENSLDDGYFETVGGTWSIWLTHPDVEGE